MEAKSLLKSAINTIDDREPVYGDRNLVYDRTAIIANTVLGLSLSSYDIMMILHAAKLARIGGTQDKVDNYLDGVNYLAFACEAKFGTAAGVVFEASTSIIDDGIAEFARKFAPVSTSSYEPHPGTVASTLPHPIDGAFDLAAANLVRQDENIARHRGTAFKKLPE